MSFTVGDEVELSCRIKIKGLFAVAKWIREETKETLEVQSFSYDEHSSLFHHNRFPHVISRVSTDDAGNYTCAVNFDDHGSQEASYELQVKGK